MGILRRKKSTYDWVLVSVYVSLLLIGWLMLYATVHSAEEPTAVFSFDSIIGKQSMWLCISILVFIVSFNVNWKFWYTFSLPIYLATILLLLLVLFFGTEIKGSKAWFNFGNFSIQPAEFAKFGTALALSSFLSSFKVNIRIINNFFSAFALILIPIILILFQPDVGSAVVFLSFFFMLYRAGFSSRILLFIIFSIAIAVLSLKFNSEYVTIGIVLLGVIFLHYYSFSNHILAIISILLFSIFGFYLYLQSYIFYLILLSILVYGYFIFVQFNKRDLGIPILVVFGVIFSILLSFSCSYLFDNALKPHQQDRINVWLKPEKCDPHGNLYNIIQSKLAIGSGGWKGKGFLEGNMTKLNFVPEQSTDFIFSTIGEEQGFVGSVGVIFLFTILIIRIIIIAERAKIDFIRYYAYGVAGIFFFHYVINIGMTIGLMPVIGIPLPLISKGGSSLIGFTLLIAVLIRLDTARFERM